MAFVLHIPLQNQTSKVMKTSTFLQRTFLGLSFFVLLTTANAFSHPGHHYPGYGDHFGWSVPKQVLLTVNQSYYDYDLVHVRQIVSRGYTDYEFILEKRGYFIAVYADRYGRILRSTRIVDTHFAMHSCDMYCGFHGAKYQRQYRPQPTVIINSRPTYHKHGNGKGYGHGHNKNREWDNHKHGKGKGNGYGHNKGHERNDNEHGYRESDNGYKEHNSDGYRRGRSGE